VKFSSITERKYIPRGNSLETEPI